MMTHVLRCLALVLSTLPLAADEAEDAARTAAPVAQKDLEAAELKLLEAELLEISSGELEKAMTIYSSIHARGELPGALRARALLCLGRCQRKLGRLDEARRLLEEIVAKHAGEADLVRQARSFLRELESGKPESPDFDWLRELERNPEIQARVFDLAMQLTKTPDKEEMVSARRQLLALGVIAVPVLEKMVETTRDPVHRRELAVVLCQLGRFEHLLKVLSTTQPPSFGTNQGSSFASFCAAVPSMAGEDRSRLLEVVAKIPDDPAIRKEKLLLRMWAGDRQALGELAAAEQEFEGWGGLPFALQIHLASQPESATALAARILDPEIRHRERRGYYQALGNQRPQLLTVAHMEAVLRGALSREQGQQGPRGGDEHKEVESYVRWLDEHDGHGVLLRLVAEESNEPARAAVLSHYQLNYTPAGAKPPSAQPAWSKIVRACQVESLFSLALRDDAAIPELVDFLESGEPVPDVQREDRRLSPAYLEAMGKLLASPRPAARAFALEALAAEGDDSGGELFARFLSLAREDEDLHVREFALYGLVRCLGARPERAPEVAEALARELARRGAMETMPTAYLDPPLGKLEYLGIVQRGHIEKPPQPGVRPRRVGAIPARAVRPGVPAPGPARSPGQPVPPTQSLAWILHTVADQLPSAIEPLHRQAFDLANAGKDRALHEWLWSTLQNNMLPPLLCDRLGEVSDRTFQAWIILESQAACLDSRRAAAPGREPFHKRAINDRELSVEARWQVFAQLVEPWTRLEDPVAFFRGDDPVFDRVCRHDDGGDTPERRLWLWVDEQEARTRLAILDAAMASSIENARVHAAEHLPLELESSRPLFERAFKDASPTVRAAAARRLNQTTRVDVAPLFHQLLGDAEPGVRLECVSALARIASQDSLEPLGKLLDDPDTRVREKAFEALKTIRQRLDEKGEWKKILDGLKAKDRG